MKFYINILPLLLALSFSLEPCSSSKKGPPRPKASDVIFEVETTEPRLEEVARKLSLTGKLEASDQLIVQTELSGVISKVYVNEGDRVSKGDPLAFLEDEELNLSLESKQDELREAELELEEVQQQFEISETIGAAAEPTQEKAPLFLDDEVPSENDDEEPYKENEIDKLRREQQDNKSENNKQKLGLQITQLEKKIENLTQEISLTEKKIKQLIIKAPIGGIVQSRFITEGSLIYEKQKLFEIVTINPLKLSLQVPKELSSYVDKMIDVRVSPQSAPEYVGEASIYFISPSLDQVNDTLELKLHVTNDDNRMKAGQMANAVLITRKMDKIFMIPRQALIQKPTKNVIYVVNGPQAHETKVDIIENLNEDELLVKAKLRIDDPIVIRGHSSLSDKSFVKVVESEKDQ